MSSFTSISLQVKGKFNLMLECLTPEIEFFRSARRFSGSLSRARRVLRVSGREIQEKPFKHVGILVAGGIGETKTRANIANRNLQEGIQEKIVF